MANALDKLPLELLEPVVQSLISRDVRGNLSRAAIKDLKSLRLAYRRAANLSCVNKMLFRSVAFYTTPWHVEFLDTLNAERIAPCIEEVTFAPYWTPNGLHGSHFATRLDEFGGYHSSIQAVEGCPTKQHLQDVWLMQLNCLSRLKRVNIDARVETSGVHDAMWRCCPTTLKPSYYSRACYLAPLPTEVAPATDQMLKIVVQCLAHVDSLALVALSINGHLDENFSWNPEIYELNFSQMKELSVCVKNQGHGRACTANGKPPGNFLSALLQSAARGSQSLQKLQICGSSRPWATPFPPCDGLFFPELSICDLYNTTLVEPNLEAFAKQQPKLEGVRMIRTMPRTATWDPMFNT